MITTKYTTQRREVGSTGKTGHQWTQLLLTVSQVVQFCTHVLGVERKFNMLVSKDGEVVQRYECLPYKRDMLTLYQEYFIKSQIVNLGQLLMQHEH